MYDTKKGQGIICKENILKGPYKRPENFKEIEKKYDGVLIWGDENPNELLNKITSLKNQQFKRGVGLVIISTMSKKRDIVREFLNLLKNYDKELYNSFGNKLLKRVGLKTTNKWKFW